MTGSHGTFDPLVGRRWGVPDEQSAILAWVDHLAADGLSPS